MIRRMKGPHLRCAPVGVSVSVLAAVLIVVAPRVGLADEPDGFRAPTIPWSFSVSSDGSTVSVLDGGLSSFVVEPPEAHAEWVAKAKAGETRVGVVVDGAAKAFYALPWAGEVFAAEDEPSASVTRVHPERAAFEVKITGGDTALVKADLRFRPRAAPRVAFTDGFGIVSQSLGAKNEGRLTGTITFASGSVTDYLVIEQRWRGTRLFGWVGAKSRTSQIPANTIMSASLIRVATAKGGELALSDEVLVEVKWRVPPHDIDREEGRRYGTASAKIKGRIDGDQAANFALLDRLVRERSRAEIERVCCYQGSSVSAYTRFERSGGRCERTRRCTAEETDWLNK